MTTAIKPEVESVEHLDFEQMCDVSVVMVHQITGEIGTITPCEEPARWAGTFPCCGVVFLTCERHRNLDEDAMYQCGACKKDHHFLLNWRRI